jgi:hypothetical protein
VYEELKYRLAQLPSSSNAAPAILAQTRDLADVSGPAEPSVSEGVRPEVAMSPSGRNQALARGGISARRGIAASGHSSHEGPSSSRTLTALETSACAVLSKLAASVSTYPSQVIR